MEQTPMFSIFYYDKDGNQIKATTPVEHVMKVGIEINVTSLVDNPGLGTALLKGFMQERTEEFERLIKVVRAKKKENSRIITPAPAAMSGLKVVN